MDLDLPFFAAVAAVACLFLDLQDGDKQGKTAVCRLTTTKFERQRGCLLLSTPVFHCVLELARLFKNKQDYDSHRSFTRARLAAIRTLTAAVLVVAGEGVPHKLRTTTYGIIAC